MSELATAVSGSEPIRRKLRGTAEAVGLRAVLITLPGPEGESVRSSSDPGLSSAHEGELLDPATSGLDERSLPIIDPSGGHVSGALRWILGASRTPLEQDELEALSACAEALALAPRATADTADPGAADPYLPPDHPTSPEAHVMRLLAALAIRTVKTAWELDRLIQLAEAVARELELGAEGITTTVHLAMLKDIGSLGIPPRVLSKRGLLDRSEARLLREQPILGERIVAAMPDLTYLAPLIRASREDFGGGGYPDGLAGEEIPLPSRIIKVCDAHVAMLADRPYRKALPADVVASILAEKAGSDFCPTSLAAFERVLATEAAPPPISRAQAPLPAEPPPVEPASARSKREPPPVAPEGAAGRRGQGARPGPSPEGRRAAARAALARGRTPERAAKVFYPLALILGATLGVIIALPVPSAEGRCPPAGEARTQCILQKVWLHELTVVFVVTLATLVVGYMVVFRLPDAFRRWRAGELFSHEPPPPISDDPILLAATWGWSGQEHGRAHRFGRRHGSSGSSSESRKPGAG